MKSKTHTYICENKNEGDLRKYPGEIEVLMVLSRFFWMPSFEWGNR
jgi:hypothetical protein